MNFNYRTIDHEIWERKDAYLGFKEFDFPNSVVGVEVDITKAYRFWRDAKLSPYLCLVYAVCRSANKVPAFKQRIRGDEVVELEVVHADFTVPKGEDSFSIKLVEYNDCFQKFYEEATNVEAGWGIPGDGNPTSDNWIYMSCMPWVKFTHIVQPTDRMSGSIPRIAWGKFLPEAKVITLPFSIQTHHALVDGIHVARFLSHLEAALADPEIVFARAII